MKNLFDLIFYEIYIFSHSRKDIAPETNGYILLSLIQFVFLFDLLLILSIIFDFDIPLKFYFIPFMLAIGLYNYYKYEHNFELKGIEKYKHTSELFNRKRKILVLIFSIFIFLFPIVFGIVDHNMNVF